MIVHTEWIDPHGMRAVRWLLSVASEECASDAEAQRIRFLNDYLDAIDATYGSTTHGPLGCPARPLLNTYVRVRDGRLYSCTNRGPRRTNGVRSYICAQGMPSALRPYLMAKWVHDLDIENCHVALMYQIGAYYHVWPEHGGRVKPLQLSTLAKLYHNRAAFIEHIAEVHMLPTDADMYDGYRKEMCKPLLLRIMYGGSYATWMQEHGLCGIESPWIKALAKEFGVLRQAVNNSARFAPLVERERAWQKRRSRSVEATERGVFSKIAQHLECIVLLSMRRFLVSSGWNIHSLVFDGLMVEHRPHITLCLNEIERHVERDTQFVVKIVEKKLYMHTPNRQGLLR